MTLVKIYLSENLPEFEKLPFSFPLCKAGVYKEGNNKRKYLLKGR